MPGPGIISPISGAFGPSTSPGHPEWPGRPGELRAPRSAAHARTRQHVRRNVPPRRGGRTHWVTLDQGPADLWRPSRPNVARPVRFIGVAARIAAFRTRESPGPVCLGVPADPKIGQLPGARQPRRSSAEPDGGAGGSGGRFEGDRVAECLELTDVVAAAAEGTPQGSPLSPILSNIILDDLDWELEQRGHRFVRYAKEWKTTAAKRHNLRIRGISESSARKWGGAARDAGGPCCRRACGDPPPEPTNLSRRSIAGPIWSWELRGPR